MSTNLRLNMSSLSVPALAVFISFASIVYGGGLEPAAAPAPTMKTLQEVEPRTPISSVPYTIENSGSYYLTADLALARTDTSAIIIKADEVTLDLMGYSIVGPDVGTGSGILIDHCSNVEVRNGSVKDFGQHGIFNNDYYGEDSRIINIRAVSNKGTGIYLMGFGGLVQDCTAAENGNRGIETGKGCIIRGCSARNNAGYGIYAGHGNIVDKNNAYYNQNYGIRTGNSCIISNNLALDNNGGYGISTGMACTVIYNNVFNSQSGFSIGQGSTCIGNVARGNERYGIYANADCMVDQNTATGNNTGGGAYPNMYVNAPATVGTNHAP